MRPLADQTRIRRFIECLGAAARQAGRVYFSGGASAVLVGWRAETIDADILVVPDNEAVLRALPEIKESLGINVELAWPAQFFPELPGWRERSRFIERQGALDFFHYDFHAQAMAKALRAQAKDLRDVTAMLERGLVEPGRLWGLYRAIEAELYRYPSLSAGGFRAALEAAFGPEPATWMKQMLERTDADPESR